MPRRKRDDHEEHENHEAWVIPYADMLTLLMGLFLVLWSMSTTDAAKAIMVSAGFAEELGVGPAGGQIGAGNGGDNGGNAVTGSGTGQVNELEKTLANAERLEEQARRRETAIQVERADLEEARRRIQAEIDARGLGDLVHVRVEPDGLVVVATEGLLFASGSAALEEAGRAAIDIVAGPMSGLTQPVRIEGHTDSTPIATGTFPSNWELSTTRASTVLRYLTERFGIAPERLSAAGYADTRPVGDNATAEGRAANRRVEIKLVAVAVTEPLPGAADPLPPPGATAPSPTPAPIGPDGPLGLPERVTPDLPQPTAGA